MATVQPIRRIEDLNKLQNIFKSNQRNLLIFLIGINCGLRISDILALNINDVVDKEFITITEVKTKKKRTIPLNNKVKNLINKFIKDKEINSPLFINNRDGKRLSRISAYRILKQACADVKLKGTFGTHTLRKTFGYHFYKKYNDIVMLQKILNHSSPFITLKYIGITEEEIYKCCIEFEL